MDRHPEAIQMLDDFIRTCGKPDSLLRPNDPSLLRMAVEHTHPKAVERLVAAGADLDMTSGQEQWTALHHAVDIDIDSVNQANPEQGKINSEMYTFNMTRQLLRLGASDHIVDSDGYTPRDLAAEYGLGELFDQIVASSK